MFFLELSKCRLAKVLITDIGIYLCSHRITSISVYLLHKRKRLLAAIYHVLLCEQIGSQRNVILQRFQVRNAIIAYRYS